ncbi:hypothetical protein BBJ28_00011949 [Nothophytophthora sp. Chile5]|nr:hypothetical protein BBJ28_00011949 [Nothophytophthora sp. Chile5]
MEDVAPRRSSPRTRKKRRLEGPPRGTGAAIGAERSMGVKSVGFQVRSASGAAGTGGTNHLLSYSMRSCWQSYARPTETLVLALCVLHALTAGERVTK